MGYYVCVTIEQVRWEWESIYWAIVLTKIYSNHKLPHIVEGNSTSQRFTKKNIKSLINLDRPQSWIQKLEITPQNEFSKWIANNDNCTYTLGYHWQFK